MRTDEARKRLRQMTGSHSLRSRLQVLAQPHEPQSLGVPYEGTWSCSEGGEIHCGLCGTCIERKEAFLLANVRDPTKYRK